MTQHTDLPAPSFSVDLVPLARQHVEFLRALHAHGTTLTRPSAESLRRYTQLWLPLVYQYHNGNTPASPSKQLLIPPADVAWLWHCHRLAPFRYSSYCKRRFGKDSVPPEATPPFSAHFVEHDEVCYGLVDDDDDNNDDGEDLSTLLEEMVSRTLDQWTSAYPNESFHLAEHIQQDKSLPPEISGGSSPPSLLLDGFDLLASTDRQATFLWQVSASSFDSQSFLEDGSKNYQKFLHLKKEFATANPNMVIVPTYQIDLMWHTHMLSSLQAYYADCVAIMGSRLHHDDSLNDRTEGGPLDAAFNETKAAWKELYGEEYRVEGGMYRGEPPAGFYLPTYMLDRQTKNDCCKDQLVLSSVSSNLVPPASHPFTKFVDVQGASSTNPAHQGSVEMSQGAYGVEVIWCWKETKSQMKLHEASNIVGDPVDCWIRYNALDNETLEAVFQQHGGNSEVTIGRGSYKVDFSSMKQTKTSTGFEREVRRCIQTTGPDGLSTIAVTTSDTAPTVSSSTTTTRVETSALPQATAAPRWTMAEGRAPDGQPGFLPPNPKSNTRGVNANGRKDQYVFGTGSKGLGYYHITTRDAYAILEKRITARVFKVSNEIAMQEACDRCLSCGMNATKRTDAWTVRKEKERAELQGCLRVIRARARSDIPLGVVGLPADVTTTNTNNNQTDRDRDNMHLYGGWYDGGGMWLLPASAFDAGGGCGATGIAGGGCGGGAGGCGGGACGGGACGGGGCGGGGCGGGG